MANKTAATTATFDDEVTKSPVLVIADFWADWCVPCKTTTPLLEEIARGFGNQVKLVTINADAEPEIAQRYDIMSMPTILLFRKGEVVRRQVGAIPRHMLEKMISETLSL